MDLDVIGMDVWNIFGYKGKIYYIEIFQHSDQTFKAFASKNSLVDKDYLEYYEGPVGMGWHHSCRLKAAIKAIRSLKKEEK